MVRKLLTGGIERALSVNQSPLSIIHYPITMSSANRQPANSKQRTYTTLTETTDETVTIDSHVFLH
jgi:hypothetical protein